MALSFILFKGFGSRHNGRRTDRKRKQHLRQYIREEETDTGEDEPDSPHPEGSV